MFTPRGPHIHVRLVDAAAVSGGGIHIPATAQKRPLEAVVLAVGDGWRDEYGKLHPIDLVPGERVMFGRYAGTPLRNDKELALRTSEVLAVIGVDGESIRAHQDNVILRMAPEESLSTIIEIKDHKAKSRRAMVMVSGRGYVTSAGVFVENTVKEGQRVAVDRDAGQDYAMDIDVPRHNKKAVFESLFGHDGEFRIVREQEILGMLSSEDEGAN